MLKPICTKCEVQFKPEKNGVDVIAYSKGEPQEIWRADLWKCPKCGKEIIAGYGQSPFASCYEDDFEEKLQEAKDGKYTFKLNYDQITVGR